MDIEKFNSELNSQGGMYAPFVYHAPGKGKADGAFFAADVSSLRPNNQRVFFFSASDSPKDPKLTAFAPDEAMRLDWERGRAINVGGVQVKATSTRGNPESRHLTLNGDPAHMHPRLGRLVVSCTAAIPHRS